MKKLILSIFLIIAGTNICTCDWIRVDSFEVTAYRGFPSLSPLQTGYVDIKCLDSLNCAAVALLGIDRYAWLACRNTQDGGKTWFTSLLDTSIYFSSDSVKEYCPPAPFAISFPSKDLCIIVCDSGYYYETRDNFKSWTKYRMNTKNILAEVQFINKDIGVINDFKDFHFTKTGGKTWEQINIKGTITDNSINNFFVYDTSLIYMVCAGPYPEFVRYVFKSEDFGKTWKKLFETPYWIRDMHFSDREHGVMAGMSSNYKSIIFYTSDGGSTWKKVLDSLTKPIYGISKLAFYDNIGFGLGKEAFLWQTTDYGKSWFRDTTFHYPNISDACTGLAFLNKSTILVTSMGYGTIFKKDYSEINGVFESKIEQKSKIFVLPSIVKEANSLAIRVASIDVNLANIEIFDENGKQMDKQILQLNSNSFNDFQYRSNENFVPGMYFIKASFNNGTYATDKFIILK